jgi:hypothetical protein
MRRRASKIRQKPGPAPLQRFSPAVRVRPKITPSRNSKDLITLNLVEDFTAVRIGFRIFTMKTVQSQMLEHRNQKGDLPSREKRLHVKNSSAALFTKFGRNLPTTQIETPHFERENT